MFPLPPSCSSHTDGSERGPAWAALAERTFCTVVCSLTLPRLHSSRPCLFLDRHSPLEITRESFVVIWDFHDGLTGHSLVEKDTRHLAPDSLETFFMVNSYFQRQLGVNGNLESQCLLNIFRDYTISFISSSPRFPLTYETGAGGEVSAVPEAAHAAAVAERPQWEVSQHSTADMASPLPSF